MIPTCGRACTCKRISVSPNHVIYLCFPGKWNDNHCAVSQGYACKRYMSPFPMTTPTSPPAGGGGCPDGFVQFQSRCYAIFGQQGGKTWQEALHDCKSRSTPFLRVTMASIRNHRENGQCLLSPFSSSRAHLHVVGMLRFMFLTQKTRACPFFILFLCLCPSLWPFQVYSIS